jgi:hypothetical protein
MGWGPPLGSRWTFLRCHTNQPRPGGVYSFGWFAGTTHDSRAADGPIAVARWERRTQGDSTMFRSLSTPLAIAMAALWFGAFAADGAEAGQRGRHYRPRSRHYSYSRGYRQRSHRYTVPRFGSRRYARDRHHSSSWSRGSRRGSSGHRIGGGIWFSFGRDRDRDHGRREWRSRSHRRDWRPRSHRRGWSSRSHWRGGRSYRGGGCR